MRRTIAIRHRGRSTEAIASETTGSEVIPIAGLFAETAQLIRMISDPARLQILWWLARDEWSVTDLCALTGMSEWTMTPHLRAMKRRQLVAFRQWGRYHRYGLTDEGRVVTEAVTRLIQ
jgi:DNA-binding transcriptional ArsR family regulator